MATTTRPAYVDIGQCGRCKLGWRTNASGELKLHRIKGKQCAGSYGLPVAVTAVLKDLYAPGEKWPKRRM